MANVCIDCGVGRGRSTDGLICTSCLVPQCVDCYYNKSCLKCARGYYKNASLQCEKCPVIANCYNCLNA